MPISYSHTTIIKYINQESTIAIFLTEKYLEIFLKRVINEKTTTYFQILSYNRYLFVFILVYRVIVFDSAMSIQFNFCEGFIAAKLALEVLDFEVDPLDVI